MMIAAKYEKGVFKPLEKVQIKEGAIVEIYVPNAEKAKRRSIRNLGFAGMWADRDDITDGVSFCKPPRQPGDRRAIEEGQHYPLSYGG
jgi:Protein of unknown function DUF104